MLIHTTGEGREREAKDIGEAKNKIRHSNTKYYVILASSLYIFYA